MKVKVIRCNGGGKNSWWYKDHIGDIFEVKSSGNLWILENPMSGKYSIYKSDCEVINSMTKEELKNFMLVQYRCGDWRLVVDNNLYDLKDGDNSNSLMNYNNDLVYNSMLACNLDIVKIAKIGFLEDIFSGMIRQLPVEKFEGFTILWQRKSEEQEKLEQVIADLQQQINTAQKKLEEISK
jgi:hypothetical protein